MRIFEAVHGPKQGTQSFYFLFSHLRRAVGCSDACIEFERLRRELRTHAQAACRNVDLEKYGVRPKHAAITQTAQSS